MTSKKRSSKKSKRGVSKSRNVTASKTQIEGGWSDGVLVDQSGKSKHQVSGGVFRSISKSFSSPLPPPDDFAKYSPMAQKWIMRTMTEEQQIYKNVQMKNLDNNGSIIHWAGLSTMGIVCVAGAVAGIAAWMGNAYIAVPIGLAGVIQVLIQILREWLQQKRNRAAK